MTSLIPQIVVELTDESVRLTNRIEAKERRVLFRTAGYGRTTMRRLFRRRKKSSPVGTPPSAHAAGGSGFKDVRFSVNPQRLTVMIGNPKYARSKNVISAKPVPQLQNEGGAAILVSPKTGQRYAVTIAPRPFREQALQTADKFMRRIMETQEL